MTYETVFNISNGAAALAWVYLIFLPRWKVMDTALFLVLIPALSFAYSALVFVHFFTVPGGGFSSIDEVRQLFLSDPVLVAGWIHYLAFDLFVGWWIAREADAASVSRLVQAPIFAATFLFGPLGLLLFLGIKAGSTRLQLNQGKAAA
ncbi:MAG: ABA4-like family protein [Rhizobiaceae bacterium]